MKTKLARWLLVSACFVSSAVFSAEAPQAYANCVACHGTAGEGNATLNSPALAGQQAAYLARQLQHFKSGVRGADPKDTLGAQMRGMAAALTDEDIDAISAHLAQLPPPALARPAEGDLRNGNNFYQSKCGACHGGRAEGNAALNAPALAWLDSAYLERQYRSFQNGVRGAHPDDRIGRQMQMMSTTLPSDKDLADVIAFIHSLAAAP